MYSNVEVGTAGKPIFRLVERVRTLSFLERVHPGCGLESMYDDVEACRTDTTKLWSIERVVGGRAGTLKLRLVEQLSQR